MQTFSVLAVPLCRLDRRWVLWHEFMKEHAHLDAWLRLAEQAVSSLDTAPVSYSTAKEELKKFEVIKTLKQLVILICEDSEPPLSLSAAVRTDGCLFELFLSR